VTPLRTFPVIRDLVTDVEFNYQKAREVGRGNQASDGKARWDFGASDGPMNDEQLKAFQEQARIRILHFPTVLGAVVPTYNIPGVTGGLNFTPDALAGIFLGKITKWNDPLIAGANKGVNLPSAEIVVVHRSDGSGTTIFGPTSL